MAFADDSSRDTFALLNGGERRHHALVPLATCSVFPVVAGFVEQKKCGAHAEITIQLVIFANQSDQSETKSARLNRAEQISEQNEIGRGTDKSPLGFLG